MTDEEKIRYLIKCANSETIALAVWRKPEEKCEIITLGDVAAIITHQQAEIERLTINMNAFGLGMKQEKERADTIKVEAIKEFAERLQYEIDHCDEQGEIFINSRSINEVLKEIVGEQDV